METLVVKPRNKEGQTQNNEEKNQQVSKNEDVIDMSFDLTQKDQTNILNEDAKKLFEIPIGVKAKG